MEDMEMEETNTLSSLLEKISEKYPDDKDVLEAINLYEEEDMDDYSEEDMFAEEAPEGGGASPLDLESLLSEDMEEDDEDEEGVTPPTDILGNI